MCLKNEEHFIYKNMLTTHNKEINWYGLNFNTYVINNSNVLQSIY